ncbi:iccG [Symbiodinium natans]|uniref:IccG protein n=1 Tax=Symbiodinium natans TaxID=878477 RepID=A0A812UYV6_9DINO|nr:iccG [Symbiodinium natans]
MVDAALTLPCGICLPNRLAKAATSEHLGDPRTGEPTRDLVELYRKWAQGGAGLIITGNVMVDALYLEGPCNVIASSDSPTSLWKEWGLASTTAAAGNNAPVSIVQLSHPGRQCPLSVSWKRPVAPSEVSFNLPGVGLQLFRRPRSMTEEEVLALPSQFAEASKKCVSAGFHGIQVHAAHGYLLSQFLSPHTNRRSDGFGGSLRNRMRILLDIVAAVRKAMGPGKLLSVKVNCQDFRAGGFKESEALELMAELEKASVDLVEVSGGTYEHMVCMGQSDQDKEGTFLDFAREVRQRVPGLPVMATGGFRSFAFCCDAVRSGGCDVVGLCRPLCLQPDLPLRWLRGEEVDASSYRVRLQVPFFQSLLIPGLSYFWHQRQLQRLGSGEPVEPIRKLVLLRLLCCRLVRAYIFEPCRLSNRNCLGLTFLAGLLSALGVWHCHTRRRSLRAI